MTFVEELNQLIGKHTDKARYRDDFIPILNALCNTADKLAGWADGYPFKGESEQDFRVWLRHQAAVETTGQTVILGSWNPR
jgi:hypothetical protein